MREALQNGFDARIAAARVEEARALYGGARGNVLPGVGYQGGVERQRADQTTNPAGQDATKWTAELFFSWELDLWGRLRRQTEAARAQYLASEEARRGVLLSLVSDVASAYFELRELDEDLAIARRTTAAFQETHDLFRRRLEGGAASALETARAEALLGSVSAQIPEIERAIVAKETELNFLLGRNPQPILRDGPLAPLPPPVPAGLPSALLERRPDVREAEQLLVAANAGIGVAKADFFPRLSLTGAFGNASRELGELFSQGKSWSIEAGLLGPLFSAGRIKGNYRASQARFEQAKVRYEADGRRLVRRRHARARRPREAGRGGGTAGRGRPRVPRGGAPREPALRVRALRVLRGAGRAAAALPRRAGTGPDAPQPEAGGREPLSRARRRLAARAEAVPAR